MTMSTLATSASSKTEACQFALISATSLRDGFSQALLFRVSLANAEPSQKISVASRKIDRKMYDYWRKADAMKNQYMDCYMRHFDSAYSSIWFSNLTNMIGVLFGIFLGAFFTQDKFWKRRNA